MDNIMENKCPTFHIIFKYIVFQRLQKALSWSKGLKCAADDSSVHIQVALDSEVIKLFSCLTQLSMKFIMIINVKMPTIVGILTFISMII